MTNRSRVYGPDQGQDSAASEMIVLMAGAGSLVSDERLVICSEPCSREQKGPNKLCLLDKGCCSLSWRAALAFLVSS